MSNKVKKIVKKMLQIGDRRISGPTTLSIFTTSRCTLSCFYCSRSVSGTSKDSDNHYKLDSEFKFEDLKMLLDKYPDIQFVSFVGIGEPFLNKDLIKMAEYSKRKGKSTSVITNGTLLHNYWGQIGANFTYISISLHGLTAEELASVAKASKETFDQIISNINHLVTEEQKAYPGMKVRASVVYLKDKQKRVIEAAEFCVKNGIGELDIHNYLPISIDDGHNCVFDDETDHVDFLKDIKEKYKGKLIITIPVIIKRDEDTLKWNCGTYDRTLRVDGYGNISGCTRIIPPLESHGNIQRENDVWNNKYYRKMRRAFRTKKDIPESCRYCPDSQ